MSHGLWTERPPLMRESEQTVTPQGTLKPRRGLPFLIFILPFSLLLDHTLYLDHWFSSYTPSTPGENGTYYLRPARGHLMSAYPVIMPLVITPLYAVPAWLVARQNPPLHHSDVIWTALLDVMEKLVAALMAALTGMIFFLSMRRIGSSGQALALTLIFGLASSTWAVSSQGLWRHGFTELCFAFLLWALVQPGETRGRAFWCGLALAGAGANNTANVVIILPLLIYFARRGKREFIQCFAPLAVLGALVAGYNFYFFGRLMGGYPRLMVGSPEGAHLFRADSVWSGLLGLLLSPSRGLLIYMPWTLFAIWGMARAWKEKSFGWERYLIAGMAGFYLEHSIMGTWWGGWAFGPRYMASVLPFLVFFLIPAWTRLVSRRPLRVALGAAVAVSLWIQFVGVFYYPQGDWDALPVRIEQEPRRLWDWKDTQIRRSWQAGPATPNVFYEIFLLGDLLRSPQAAQKASGRIQMKRETSSKKESFGRSDGDAALLAGARRFDFRGKTRDGSVGQTKQH